MRASTATPEVCLPSGFLDTRAKEIADTGEYTFLGSWFQAWERHLDAEVAALNLPPCEFVTMLEIGGGGARGAYIERTEIAATPEVAAEMEAEERWIARRRIANEIADRIDLEEWKLGI